MFELDLTDVSTESSFDPLPDGQYKSYVDGAEFKESKAGSEYLNLKFKIFSGQYSNRVFFNIMNLFHDKEQVRNIALADLKKMLMASGFESMKFDSKEDLLEAVLSCRCEVKLGNKTDSYGTKNTIKGYQPLKEDDQEDDTDCPF